MTAPLDAFVAGQYYGFYTPPNTLAAGYFNTPGISNTGGSNYNVYAADGTVIPVGTLGIGSPSWIGATRTGFMLQTQMVGEAVEGDVWGGSVVDLVYRGGNCYLSWDAIAFKYGSIVPYWPWSTLGTMGTVGRLGSVYGGSIVLVAAPGTTAANFPTIGQISLTSLSAANAIRVENEALDLIFDSRLRRVPVRVRLLPYFDALITYINATNFDFAAGIVGAGGASNTVVSINQAPIAGSSGYAVSRVANYKWFSIL